MQNRSECKLFGRRARIPACNICVKQHNSHGRSRKSSRCLAFEAFTKIRTASRRGRGRYHRHVRPFTIVVPCSLELCSCPYDTKTRFQSLRIPRPIVVGVSAKFAQPKRRSAISFPIQNGIQDGSILSIIESELVVHRLRDRVIRHRVIRPIQLSLCS